MKSPWAAYPNLSSRDRLQEEAEAVQVPLRPPWTPQEAGTTYFRVSLLLQVEQEKQCTHQALLSADTTVGVGAGRLSRPRLAQDRPGLQRQDPHARGPASGTRGWGAWGWGRDRGALPSPSITWLQL